MLASIRLVYNLTRGNGCCWRLIVWSFDLIAFLVYPYLALTILVVGHTYRYLADPFRWSSKSSELFIRQSEGLESSSLIGSQIHFFRAFLRIC